MFDLTSMKLVMLGLIALIVVGPKELPALLRTIGKYAGMVRRQATEFRSQFDEAMREAELDKVKEEMASLGREAKSTLDDASHTINREMTAAHSDLNASISGGTANGAIAASEAASVAELPPPQSPTAAPPSAAAAAAAAAASVKAGE